MHKYGIIIYWSKEDNCFIAEVPQLPGCMSDGATQTEVLDSIQIVIDEWIETALSLGREVPEPQGNLKKY